MAGTPVKTAAGYTPIETLKVGDLVQSEDPKTGAISLQHVTQVIVRPVEKIKTFYKLSVSKDGTVEDFYVTGEHPFWIADKAAWKTVDELAVGDTLADFGGHRLRVSAKAELSEKQQTYNITVEGTETYFAGKSEVLVHNCSWEKLPEGYKRIDATKVSYDNGKGVKFNGRMAGETKASVKGQARELIVERLTADGKPTGEYYRNGVKTNTPRDFGSKLVQWYVRALDVLTYKETTDGSLKGDQLTGDHMSSRASI